MDYFVITIDRENIPEVRTVEGNSRAEALGLYIMENGCENICRALIADVPPSRAEGILTDNYLFNDIMRGLKQQDRKISAIKFYRYLTGKGLRESKEFVENHWENL